MNATVRPNIVFFLSDDQGPWAAGCYANDEIRTPNIDRLSHGGVLFDNFFCSSPVCSPARASLLTGTIPSQHGVHDWIREGNVGPHSITYLEKRRSYTEVLAESGWTCGLVGKWHLGNSKQPQQGFSHWFCHPMGSGPYNDQIMIRNGVEEQTRGYITDVITDEAISFITSNKELPFYLGVHYTAPHSPWIGHPQAIVDSYDSCAFRSCPQGPIHPWAGPLTTISHGKRELLKGYFAAVTAMDHNVGRVIEVLHQLKLEQRTIVIFSSDNGFSCGQHGFWGKGNATFPINMYDSSVKVPMIVSHPGHIPAGRRTAAMMSQYDFMPTLLDYLGLQSKIDRDLPGKSFKDVWLGSDSEVRSDVVVFDEYGPTRMIRTTEWKYIHRFPFGVHELYHLGTDPGEENNCIFDPQNGEILEDLRQRLAKWFDLYASPDMDGRTLPVTGSGQLELVRRGSTGERFFARDVMTDDIDGFPRVKSDINRPSGSEST